MGLVDIIFRVIFGDKSENDIKKIMPIVEAVNSREDEMKALSDEELSGKTEEFRSRIKEIIGCEPKDLNLHEEEEKKKLQNALNTILPEAFAVVREASRRTTGMRHFDVQIIGGIVLHQGRIAEMKTGEGKTLAATLPVYLNALTSLGVHVVTVNDYLAKRDAEWMSPIYKMLGLTVGVIDNSRPHSEERRKAYAADITYGTNNEFGFDYLRDNMVHSGEEKVQRSFYYGIVDEVDSVLIDEARTPLIISGPTEKNVRLYYDIDKIIPRLTEAKSDERGKEIEGTGDYILDEKDKNVYLTEEGVARVEELLGVTNLYGSKAVDMVHHVNQALKAHKLFKKEVDYIVSEGSVLIVDEFTGRVLDGRRYSDGLHQAIEAKERVNIQNESQTYATVTFQNYFRMFPKLSGMTGTAETEAEEFMKIYKLDVTVIPTNKPITRKDESDRIYRTKRGKMQAIASYIKQLQDEKKPVLVGTVSVEMNEELAKVFKNYKISFEVLNAKNHLREAKIIGDAGSPGSVTLATNMAGRGTDIVLGGNPIEKSISEIDHIITQLRDKAFKEKDPVKKEELTTKIDNMERYKEAFVRNIIAGKISEAKEIADKIDAPEMDEKISVIESIRERCAKDKEYVLANGGLHVIGSERHESRRIDNQLRGRSGRQGDAGLSVFFLSLEDDLMRLFGTERVGRMMQAMGMKEDEELQHPWLNKTVEGAQRKVEGRNFEIRKHLLEYDDVMNKQRIAIYAERDNVLMSDSIKPRIMEIFEEVVQFHLDEICPPKQRSAWDMSLIRAWLGGAYLTKLSKEDESEYEVLFQSGDSQSLFKKTFDIVINAYLRKRKEVSEHIFNEAEKHVFLQLIDTKWKEHLYAMDVLRQGIGLRGYAQLDALTEYKLEGYKMFEEMVHSLKEEILEMLFHMRINPQFVEASEEDESTFSEASEQKPDMSSFDASGEGGHQTQPKIRNQAIAGAKVGRNEPCPCGSGKKYKHCHGREQQ